MKLSKTDMTLLSMFIESCNPKNAKSSFNDKGIKKLAKIHSEMTASVLGINAKDIYKTCENNIIESLNN